MTAAPFHVLNFGGEVIRFVIERTARRKTVALSVGHEGVRVLAPSDLDDARVLSIVRGKAAWILRKQDTYRELGGPSPVREFVSGETFHYLGRAHRLKVVEDSCAVVTRVIARGSLLVAPVLPNAGPAIRRAAIRNGLRLWYRGHAMVQFPERAKMIACRLDVPLPVIRIVDQSKRWGSCDAKGRLRLNWRLVMAPMSLIDYVIAHEACHVIEHNHSRRFWRELETIMPDYEVRVRQLDKLGHLYVW
jgi:predicted metal-dependent hydrolase